MFLKRYFNVPLKVRLIILISMSIFCQILTVLDKKPKSLYIQNGYIV